MNAAWTLADIPWDEVRPERVDPGLLEAVKAASLVEANSADYVRYLHNVFAGDDEVDGQVIFDKERNHFQLVHVGWPNDRRIYGCVVHVDIKDGKIWIQHDGTEIGIANDLVTLGVPKEDIVLAFHAPYKRKFTDFAEC